MNNGVNQSLVTRAKAALKKASANVLAIAEATGTPVVIWENGAVVEVDPKEMRRRLAATKKPAPRKKPVRSRAKKPSK